VKTIDSLSDFSNKTVLVRGDLDVALDNSVITEAYRLEMITSTITYLLERGAKVVLCGHLGRPEGEPKQEFSLKPVADWFTENLKQPVPLIAQWYEQKDAVSAALETHNIVLLENLRFYPQEEENDAAFADALASLADMYVNEAFSATHRAHASIVGVAAKLPSYAGLRLAKEITELKTVRENPERPLVMIMGGGKADTKVPVVSAMAKYANHILLGGKLMFSKELEGIKGVRFPNDSVGIKDIGPKSVELFTDYINKAATIVWNGPMGVFEETEYATGTKDIAHAVLASHARKIIGGGDTIAAMNQFGLLEKLDFVSTGGGAMLEYLSDGTLVGLETLEK